MKLKANLLFIFMLLLFMLGGCCKPSEVIGSVNNSLRPQETNMWCWAAVTQMIANNEGITVSQCELANHRFGETNCCDPKNPGSNCPKTDDCRKPGWLELDFAGLKFTETATALPLSDIRKQIYCYKNVLGFAYGGTGIGHVVAIKGYVNVGGTDYLVLNDPWSPCSGQERLITYEEYVDPAGDVTHWASWHTISKK